MQIHFVHIWFIDPSQATMPLAVLEKPVALSYLSFGSVDHWVMLVCFADYDLFPLVPGQC